MFAKFFDWFLIVLSMVCCIILALVSIILFRIAPFVFGFGSAIIAVLLFALAVLFYSCLKKE